MAKAAEGMNASLAIRVDQEVYDELLKRKHVLEMTRKNLVSFNEVLRHVLLLDDLVQQGVEQALRDIVIEKSKEV